MNTSISLITASHILPWILLGLLIAFVGLFFLIAVALFKLHQLKKNLALIWKGKEGTDIESLLVQQVADLKTLDQEIQELFEISNRLRELGLRSIHKFGVLRFNPFKEVGSNQSFSLALLDGKNNGAVLSSLHTREGTRVYAKPIKNGEADGFPLTDEERQVIKDALSNKPPVKNTP
jgi:hypothetical protein